MVLTVVTLESGGYSESMCSIFSLHVIDVSSYQNNSMVSDTKTGDKNCYIFAGL